MKFQAFHVNPGEKLKKKDVNNNLSNFMSVFPSTYVGNIYVCIYKRHVEPNVTITLLVGKWCKVLFFTFSFVKKCFLLLLPCIVVYYSDSWAWCLFYPT